MSTLSAIAGRLDRAQLSAVATAQQPAAEAVSLAAAYQIQHALIGCRAARGERLVGLKLGFTSLAKMIQMGVSSVIVGQLTDAMRIADGGTVELGELIHPRVEPEIAYRIGRDVTFDDPDEDLSQAADAVAPALEIIDSRYADFRFSLADVIADNTSAAKFVIGPWRPLGAAESNCAVVLSVNGNPVETGSTAAILGDPARALTELAGIARRHGMRLRKGSVVLAGAATAAVPLTAGLVEVQVSGLGRASVRVAGDGRG